MKMLKRKLLLKLMVLAFFVSLTLQSWNEYRIVESFVRIICRSCIGLD